MSLSNAHCNFFCWPSNMFLLTIWCCRWSLVRANFLGSATPTTWKGTNWFLVMWPKLLATPPRLLNCGQANHQFVQSGRASRHSVYTEPYGNHWARCQKVIEKLFIYTWFQVNILRNVIVVSPSFHVWQVVHNPRKIHTQFQKILM